MCNDSPNHLQNIMGPKYNRRVEGLGLAYTKRLYYDINHINLPTMSESNEGQS